MAVPISNVTRRQVYSPSGAGGAGPYSFTFEILANTDIAVYKDDTLLTLTTHYTVAINANGTGSVTITAAGLALSPTSPTQYAIVGNRTIQRTSDFTTGGDFFANTINDELDQQTIFAQQNSEGLQRALTAPQTDPTSIDMTLPRASVRANKTLAFDSNGDPTTGEVIGDNRGNWSAAVAYNKRDIVKDTSNGNVYYANTSHTSSGSQPISTNADSAKWDLIVDNASAGSSATAAAASASAAATSASNASTSASNASTSATNAAASASTASTQASNASTSATNAAASASTASTQASNASTSATNAAASASTASTQASNASTSASNASTSATNAANSASTATTQATNASNSASAASTSASNASTSATNAANSATASASSATSAAAAAAAAAASFDAFDDIYLGAKSSDPSVDNDGNALTTGDQYFNTTANELRVYNGSTWQAASTVGGTVTNLTVTNGASIQGLTVGRGAGAVSTNTAVGASALAGSNTGINNTAIGSSALVSNTSGNRNVAVGSSALSSNNTGVENTAVGHDVASGNTTGSYNVAFGRSAMSSNTTGSNNSAIGFAALPLNTTASNNTAVGYQAGYTNTTGGANTFFGYHAGYSSNAVNGSNVFVGYRAGKDITTGVSNVVLGGYMGNSGGLDIRTASNNIVLSDGDGNPRFNYINAYKSWQMPYLGGTSTSRGGNTIFSMNSGSNTYDGSMQITDAVANNVWWGLLNGNAYVMTNTLGVNLSSGATAWSSASDSRLKNVTGTYLTALSDIAQIEVVKFTWKSDKKAKPCVGVIAQSVQGVVPEAVDEFTENDEQYLSVRYTELIPLMIASIQELKAEVDSLKAQINGASA